MAGSEQDTPPLVEKDLDPQFLELRAAMDVHSETEQKSLDGGSADTKPAPKSILAPVAPPAMSQELRDSIQAVKEKLRMRVPVKLSIIKIEVEGLPKVHRFVRNRPWVKAQYGERFSWSADYIESEIGEQAQWNDLDWAFTVERNERDRQDLVIAICSKDLIIGRYILTKEEITELADSALANSITRQTAAAAASDESGSNSITNASKNVDANLDEGDDFVSIEGEIVNPVGPAGSIRILCSRKVVDGQMVANMVTEHLHPPPVRSSSMSSMSPLKRPASPSNDSLLAGHTLPLFSHTEVAVRLLSVAVMDLPSVHFLHANSPTICVDVGNYVNVTESRPNAGMAAKWSDLFWRFTVHRDRGMVMSVVSNAVLIGKCVFATEELISLVPSSSGVVSIIKLLSNGSELTGKIKVNLLVNHPEDIFAPASTITAPMRESAFPADRTDLDRRVPSHLVARAGSLEMGSIAEESAEEVKLDATGTSTVLDMLPAQMRIRSVPFTIVVQEVTVLDVKMPLMLRWLPTSRVRLRLHLGCGPYAYSTSDLQTNGRFAHWLDMVWKVPVAAANACLRITLWSRSTGLGEASLSVADLLGMPTTRTGRTEIFTTIASTDGGEITGKVRLSCHYERGLPPVGSLPASEPVTNATKALAASTKKKKADSSVAGSRAGSPGLTSRPASPDAVSVGPAGLPPLAGVREDEAMEEDEAAPLTFPLAATVKTVALVDLLAWQTSSTLFRPSVCVMIACDRKQASTAEQTPVGGALRFEKIEWTLYVRKDSLVTLSVLSKQKLLGKAEISPERLLSQPVSSQGTVQVSVVLKKDGRTAGKAVVTLALRNCAAIPDLEPALQALYGLPAESATPAPPAASASAADMHREQTLSLLESSHLLPRMPWTGGTGAMLAGPGSMTAHPPPPTSTVNLVPDDRSMMTRSYLDGAGSVVFDPRMLSTPLKQNLHVHDFTVSLDEVDIWDLAAAHALAKNSPFVSAACGKWATTTTAHEQAGSACYWTGLQWKFHIGDGQTKLRLTVHSRTRILGTAFFSLEDLVQADTDNTGYRRLQSNVLDTKKNVVGKIKISFIVDVHKKTHLSPGPAALPGLGGSPSLYSQAGRPPLDTVSRADYSHVQSAAASLDGLDFDEQTLAEQAHVSFPCTFVLVEMVTMELFPVHTVGKNVPSIKVQCGNFYSVTQKNVEGLELSAFRELNWSFPVDLASMVHFTVVSKDTVEVGVAELDVARFADIPPNLKGLRETMLVIRRKGLSAGKLVLRARLTALEDAYHDVHHPSSPSMAEAAASGLLTAGGSPSPSRRNSLAAGPSPGWSPPGDPSGPTMSVSLPPIHPPPSTSAPLLGGGQAGSVYARTKSRRTSSADRLTAPSFDPSPPLQQTQTPSAKQSGMQPSPSLYSVGGGGAMPRSHAPSLSLLSGGPTASSRPPPPSAETAGLYSSSHVRDEGDGSDDMSYLGALSVHSHLSHALAAGLAASTPATPAGGASRTGSAKQPPPQPQPVSLRGPSPSLPDLSGLGGQSVANLSMHSLFLPDSFAQPLSVCVHGIYAVEMRKVHTFTANSPSCALACGKYTVTTEERPGAGATAAWEDLAFCFSFERKAQLRLLFMSRDRPIGFCAFGREKLLNGKPAQAGRMVVLGELMDESNKSAGKAKIIYSMDMPAV